MSTDDPIAQSVRASLEKAMLELTADGVNPYEDRLRWWLNRIEHRIPNPKVAGSSPAHRTTFMTPKVKELIHGTVALAGEAPSSLQKVFVDRSPKRRKPTSSERAAKRKKRKMRKNSKRRNRR